MGALSVVFGLLRGALPLVGGFFTGGLSWVFGLLSVAWGTEIGRTVIVGLGCLFGGWVWGFSHEHAEKTRAVAAAIEQTDGRWQRKLDEAHAQSEQEVREAKNAAAAVTPTPVEKRSVITLCRSDPNCRKLLAKKQ